MTELNADRGSGTGARGERNLAHRDALLIVLITLAAAVICVEWDISEALRRWTAPHEGLQLDELPAVLLVAACCLIWFSWRRYGEASAQLMLRRATERRLADALAENQRLGQQYVDMQESERKALARDLHDELGQYLNVVKLDAVSIRDALGGDPVAGSIARTLIGNVDRIYAVVSSLIRQLRPVGFDELGVAAALDYCVQEWRTRLPEVAIDLTLECPLNDLDEARALALFRLVQESLTNVARHSRATRVQVRIERRSSPGPVDVLVTVTDDGSGADLTLPRRGLGLIGMRERVAAFGGLLGLRSRPGGGFEVTASIPVKGTGTVV